MEDLECSTIEKFRLDKIGAFLQHEITLTRSKSTEKFLNYRDVLTALQEKKVETLVQAISVVEEIVKENENKENPVLPKTPPLWYPGIYAYVYDKDVNVIRDP